MNCEKVKGLISAYLDNEVSTGEALAIRRHLQECPACAQKATELDKVRQMVKSLPKVTAPPELAHQVRKQLTAQPTPQPTYGFFRRYRWVISPLAAAAVLLIIYANIVFWPSKTETVREREISPPSVEIAEKSKIVPPAVTAEKAEEKLAFKPTISKSSPKISDRPRIAQTVEMGKMKEEPVSVPKALTTIPKKPATYPDKPIILSQQVRIACADINTSRQMLDEMINPPVDELRRAKALRARREITAGRGGGFGARTEELSKKAKKRGPETFVVKVTLPLSQKEAFIDRLRKLGTIKVSELDVRYRDRGVANKAVDRLTNDLARQVASIEVEDYEMKELAERQRRLRRAQPSRLAPSGAERRKSAPRPMLDQDTGKPSESHLFDDAEESEAEEGISQKELREEQAGIELKALEENLVKLYDLQLQRQVQAQRSDSDRREFRQRGGVPPQAGQKTAEKVEDRAEEEHLREMDFMDKKTKKPTESFQVELIIILKKE